MYLLLIQLICLCGDAHSHLALVRSSGNLYAVMKCPGTKVAMCITDHPAESIGSISRIQCANACNRLDWNWVNFITADISAECDVGECQLFNVKPQTYLEVPSCSAYQVNHFFSDSRTFSVSSRLIRLSFPS